MDVSSSCPGSAPRFVTSGNLTTGELTSLSTYVKGILMSLMMLSMIMVSVRS